MKKQRTIREVYAGAAIQLTLPVKALIAARRLELPRERARKILGSNSTRKINR